MVAYAPYGTISKFLPALNAVDLRTSARCLRRLPGFRLLKGNEVCFGVMYTMESMNADIKSCLNRICATRMSDDLSYLCDHPLKYRKANYVRPGGGANSLDEADTYICQQLEAVAYRVMKTKHRVKAFRSDKSKPLHHWHSAPEPSDTEYTVQNLEATKTGRTQSDEIIQLVSHKDSQSWIDSPGAHDNGTGTVVHMEIARLLATCDLRRSVRMLFCNEEHTPWTSRFAAEAAAARGDSIIAVMNIDSVDGKSEEDVAAGRMTHVVAHSTDEGQRLAEFAADCAGKYCGNLELRIAEKQPVNDDDGMFIKAGFPCTIMHVGSWPYADAEYHLPGDVPQRVNMENIELSTRFILATILELDGQPFSNRRPAYRR